MICAIKWLLCELPWLMSDEWIHSLRWSYFSTVCPADKSCSSSNLFTFKYRMLSSCRIYNLYISSFLRVLIQKWIQILYVLSHVGFIVTNIWSIFFPYSMPTCFNTSEYLPRYGEDPLTLSDNNAQGVLATEVPSFIKLRFISWIIIVTHLVPFQALMWL